MDLSAGNFVFCAQKKTKNLEFSSSMYAVIPIKNDEMRKITNMSDAPG